MPDMLSRLAERGISGILGPVPGAQTDVLGRRISAALVDLIVIGVLFVLLGIAFGKSETSGTSASINLTGVSALLFFALTFAYYWLGDGIAGQTLGKVVLGLRMVGTDGEPIGLGRAAIRTLTRIVDGLPAFYLVGFVTMLATGTRRQRIGDLAANSRVTRAR